VTLGDCAEEKALACELPNQKQGNQGVNRMKTKKIKTSKFVKRDTNRDPLTGAHGAHPVGVGTGAAGGGVAGAVIGAAVAGPIGAGVGAVAGAITGGMAGKSVAETIDPTVEHAYWRTQYQTRPYFTHGAPYDEFGPAYQYGWESYATHKGKTFKDVERQMGLDWKRHSGQSKLAWEDAQKAAHDAWLRVEKTCGRCSN